jgi:hypothetical protein
LSEQHARLVKKPLQERFNRRISPLLLGTGMSKRARLLLIAVLTMLSLTAVMPKFASASVPKPSVPEFTVELLDSSYDVPPSSSIDPYTGQIVTQPGYHVESKTIRFSIKNQLFTPFSVQDENGNNWTVDFYYNIRWKGHFEQDWHELYHPSDGFARAELESEYTVRSFEGEYSSTEGLKLHYQGLSVTFPPNAQVDFQVDAMTGYVHREISIPVPGSGGLFTGETSGWSETRTITILMQQGPLLTLLAVAVIVTVVAVVAVGGFVYFKKRKHQSPSAQPLKVQNRGMNIFKRLCRAHFQALQNASR